MTVLHGDFDYEQQGAGYARQRKTDPRIAALIHAALGPARTVLNVGAGAGSYEPLDRYVVAIEPSAMMRSQRSASLTPAVIASAEQLPFDDAAFDAAMATITVHQWADVARGLQEMRRVTRGPVVVLTFDGEALDRSWLARYAPELLEAERRRMPPLGTITAALGGTAEVRPVPIPNDCVDGFIDAFYARPERLLDPEVRRAQSAWSFVSAEVQARAVEALRAELGSGEWDRRFGTLRQQPTFEGALRLIVSHP